MVSVGASPVDGAGCVPPAHPALAARRSLRGKLTRCLCVSVVTTVLSLVLLVGTTTILDISAWAANVVAVAVATWVSYRLNRRWTWGVLGRSDRWREVAPFWALSFSGLALSTLAVGVADDWAAAAHVGPQLRALVDSGAHLSGFGALWVVQFVLLDRVLFARSDPQVAELP